MTTTVLAALVLLLMSAETRSVPSGEWGGQHVRVSIRADGGAVELDCAHGVIDESLALDSHQRFEAAGRYMPEHPGPVHEDELDQSRPARYRGRLDGETITFEIVFANGETVGPYTAGLGRPSRVVKCR